MQMFLIGLIHDGEEAGSIVLSASESRGRSLRQGTFYCLQMLRLLPLGRTSSYLIAPRFSEEASSASVGLQHELFVPG